MKLLALAALLVLVAGAACAGPVGFQTLTIPDGADRPLTVGVWYPTRAPASPQPIGPLSQDVAPNAPPAGRRLPLVVMSHGTGGWYASHYDTALALAHAGFVVAAVSHPGDTFDDQSRAAQIWRRPEQIHRLIDYMLANWAGHARIDPRRVGLFGFSAGGFTALVAVGGTPDLGLVAAHCQAKPAAFECGVVSRAGGPTPVASLPPASAYVHDPRIRAAVVAAPALGYTFGRAGLAAVRVPIQLWRAEDDHILPNPDYAQAVRDALPRRPEYHVVAGDDHFDFMAPCNAALVQAAPEICQEHGGFDRQAFHERFNAAIVRFFERTLD
jgi:predicted dienelactone hydrolase